ncbi:hypothetical protein DPMN_012114 [Dreissena polymorpha]|uniref:Rieske domain-containing protein n=2 Tax=Dreissena polymorpha TaxID=45954 RepID=A0A9D4S0M7_DREPO|nr:hypothetical protein DPMN_012114 [Dreissena polymorpha]
MLSPTKSSPRKNGVSVPLNGNQSTGTMVTSNSVDIALFRYKSSVFAIKEECPHAGGPLHLGEIEDLGEGLLCVRCPWHGWKVDLLSGKVLEPTTHQTESTVTYPVKVDSDGKLFIGFEGLNPKYFRVEESEF